MGDVENKKVHFCAAGEKFGNYLPKNKNLNLELEKIFKTIRSDKNIYSKSEKKCP